MIHLEGEQLIPRPVADVAAKLSDAGYVASCVADAQVTEAGPERAVGESKPKTAFLPCNTTPVA
ncbi:MAG: hypothetical protein ACKODX_09035, partial [Gemmata sp.]